jgi:hypothetical protein
MERKRHSLEEIDQKLRRAAGLATQGRSQADIAKALGISVMTYHRWRKSASRHEAEGLPDQATGRGQLSRIGELQVENAQLRRLVADLLLEKLRLEEALGQRPSRQGRR